MKAGEFVAACTAFARRHPVAVLEMPAPELAVDDRAGAHHTRSTCLSARSRMITTARLVLRTAAASRAGNPPDLFETPERQTA